MSPVRRSQPARVVAHITVTLVVGALLLVTGCSGSDSSSARPSPAPSQAVDSGTPLAEVDTTALVVPRGPLCDLVDEAAVTRALGEEATDVSAYRSGQRHDITDDLTDVVHEFGCRWRASAARAEAWVFAPPITRKRAAALVAAAPEQGCSKVPDAPAFGRPSVAITCRDAARTVVRFAGLFGDAWLTCSLALPGGDAVERAGRWCAAVAEGAAS